VSQLSVVELGGFQLIFLAVYIVATAGVLDYVLKGLRGQLAGACL